MVNQSLKRSSFIFPLFAIACGLTLLLTDPLPLQALRNGLFDQYQRWHPRDYQPVPVRIIDIDEASLSRIGQWPWPRTRLAELVGQLKEKRVAAIAFDILANVYDAHYGVNLRLERVRLYETPNCWVDAIRK